MTDEEWEQRRRAQLAYRANVGFTATTRRRAVPGSMTHGTRYAYQKRKCRCEPCREWNRGHKRDRYQRKKAA